MENVRVGGIYLDGADRIIILFNERDSFNPYMFQGFIYGTPDHTASYTKKGYFCKIGISHFDLMKELYFSESIIGLNENELSNNEEIKNVISKININK